MATVKKRTVGIFGTSANPLHEGHVAMARAALALLPLDEVSLMVTPHNPLKDIDGYSAIEHRLHLAYLTAREAPEFGTSLKVSEFEVLLKRFGNNNETATLLRHYTDMYRSIQPVWMMGGDNLAQLHLWGNWTEIMEKYPVVVFGRAASGNEALSSVAAMQYKETRVPSAEFTCTPGTWCLLETVEHPASSTEIRQRIVSGEYPPYVPSSAVEYIRANNLFGYRN